MTEWEGLASQDAALSRILALRYGLSELPGTRLRDDAHKPVYFLLSEALII